jgi:hypothetical protein
MLITSLKIHFVVCRCLGSPVLVIVETESDEVEFSAVERIFGNTIDLFDLTCPEFSDTPVIETFTCTTFNPDRSIFGACDNLSLTLNSDGIDFDLEVDVTTARDGGAGNGRFFVLDAKIKCEAATGV